MLRYLEASNPKIGGATRDDAAYKSAAGATSSLLRLSIIVGFGSGEAAPARSPRSFDAGAVGLGIVAAMSCGGGGGGGGGAVVRKPGAATAAAMARAEPIPIGRAAAAAAAAAGAAKRARTREEMELSESYTCVISHVGGNRVRKRVYFGDGYVGAFYDDVDDHLAGGATSDDGEAPPPPPPPGDFLSKCYLCNQKLDGLDVYMYRYTKN